MTAIGEPVRLIEPGATVFSAAEIRVAIVPVGNMAEDVFASYASLVTAFRQVELANVRSFYKEAQKSPFNSFPWKQGTMHFHYVPQEAGTDASPLAALMAHRRVLGVVGLLYCPAAPDVAQAYAAFENQCRSFPDAVTVRCFAFEPSDAQMQQDTSGMPGLLMFPPGDAAVLANHAEVVMHDLAAGLLVELERLMLTSGTASVSMNTFLDSAPEFQAAVGAASALEAMSSRLYNDDELLKKRRFGRLTKALGDYALLAGSPADATAKYQAAADLARASSDFIWAGASLEGLAHARVLRAAMASGVMRGSKHNSSDGSRGSPEQAHRTRSVLMDPRLATIKAQTAAGSVASAGSGGFGGRSFWSALASAGIVEEVQDLFLEAKGHYRRRGGLPLLVEVDLKLARLLAGVGGPRARSEVSALVSSMAEAGHGLPHPADRLAVVIEASQVVGAVGSARKRTLMLWQAVELSRAGDAPDTATLDIARRALEPPPDPRAPPPADTLGRKSGGPLASGVPRHWSLVRCGCIEGVLATAILAQQHSDVWDAAAMLLREHAEELPAQRQASLLETLAAAASLMSPAQKSRAGPGPPPLLQFRRPLPPPPHLLPRLIDFQSRPASAGEAKGPFIFTPFSARREPAVPEGPVQWVAGEAATVEVDISNPTTIPIKVERLTLEASHAGDPALPPATPPAQGLNGSVSQPSSRTSVSSSVWKPSAVALWMPPGTKPTKVQLQAMPTQRGLYHLSGCRTTVLAVTWSQPWTPNPPSLGQQLHPRLGRGSSPEDVGGSAAARVTVVAPLPLLSAHLDTPDASLVLPPEPPPQAQGGQAGRPKRQDVHAAPQSVTVCAARGQLLAWGLRLANRGRLPVTSAQATVVVPDLPGARPGTGVASGLVAQVDEVALTAALPLAPGATVTVPLFLHPAQTSSYGGEEELHLEVRVEYVCDPSAARNTLAGSIPGSRAGSIPSSPGGGSSPGGSRTASPQRGGPSPRGAAGPAAGSSLSHRGSGDAAARDAAGAGGSGGVGELSQERADGGPGTPPAGEAGPLLGRRLSLPVHLLLQPSVQVSAVNVLLSDDAPSNEGQHAALEPGSSAPQQPSTSCVLEVDASSRIDSPVEVWVGHRRGFDSAGGLAAWHAWMCLAGNRGAMLTPPGRRAWVHSSLPSPLLGNDTAEPSDADTSGQQQQQSGSGASPAAAAVAAVCRQMVVYWRRPEGATNGSGAAAAAGVGVVPLPPELVAGALSDAALALLAPQPLSLRLTLQPAGDADAAQQPPAPVQWQVGGQAPDGKLQAGRLGTAVCVGQPLRLCVDLSNQGNAAATVSASLACTSSSGDAAEAEPGTARTAVDASSSILCAGAPTGFTIEAEPDGGSGSHALGVCFLAGGLYQLHLCDVAVEADAAGQKTQASRTIAAQVPSVSLHSICILVK